MDRHSWCPKCRVYVHNNQVTFQENHDGCGCPVLEKDPEESCAALRARCEWLEKVVMAAENVMTLFDYPTAYQDMQERLVGELRTALHELE